jgi:hypothetical protein
VQRGEGKGREIDRFLSFCACVYAVLYTEIKMKILCETHDSYGTNDRLMDEWARWDE